MEKLWERVVKHYYLNKGKNSWLKEKSIEELLRELEGEIAEVREELKRGDREKLADEIGDLLRDVLNILALASYRGIGEREVLQRMVAKDVRRKPWLYWEEVIDAERQVAMWEEGKKREQK